MLASPGPAPDRVGFRDRAISARAGAGQDSDDPSPLGRRRIHTDLCGLLLIACWIPLTTAIDKFSALCGVWWGEPGWQVEVTGQLLAAAAMFMWLCYLVIGRTPWRPDPRLRLRRMALRCSAAVVGLAAVGTAEPVDGRLPWPTLGEACFAAALAWLTVEILRCHGITPARIGLCPPAARTTAGRVEGWDITVETLIICAVGEFPTAALVWLLKTSGLGVRVPVMRGSQLDVLGITSSWGLAAAVMSSAVLEDLVVIAAVSLLLGAARRPLWLIYLVPCLLEVGFHVYFGVPAVAILPFGWYRVRLYRRHSRLTPLIVGHAVWDMAGGLTSSWTSTSVMTVRAVLLSVYFLADHFLVAPHRTPKTAPDDPHAASAAPELLPVSRYATHQGPK